MTTKELIDLFLKCMENRRHAAIDAWIDKVAKWASYQILYGNRIDMDPPWDYSGFAVRTGIPHNAQDYDVLSGFLDEYTEDSTDTFKSGCGLAWDTYRQELERMAEECAHAWIEGALSDLRWRSMESFTSLLQYALEQDPWLSEVPEEKMLITVAHALMDASDPEVRDCFLATWELADELLELVENMPASELLRRGRDAAEAKWRAELKLAEQSRLRYAALREQVEAVVADLAEAYPAVRRRGLTIGKKTLEWAAVKSVIKDWPAGKLHLLAESGLFSKPLSSALKRGTLP